MSASAYSGKALGQKLGIKPWMRVKTRNAPGRYQELLGPIPPDVQISTRLRRTDLTEDVIRDVALPMGLVDVKVCAVDETWSGLKLVIRKANRKS